MIVHPLPMPAQWLMKRSTGAREKIVTRKKKKDSPRRRESVPLRRRRGGILHWSEGNITLRIAGGEDEVGTLLQAVEQHMQLTAPEALAALPRAALIAVAALDGDVVDLERLPIARRDLGLPD